MTVALPNQATRLLGRGPNSKARPERPASTIEGAAWAGAAAYLAGRLQVSGEEVGNTPGHERRKADMSPAAGAAMHAVLKEMGKEGSEAADAAAGVSRLTRLASPAVPPLRTSTPYPTHPTHPTHPHGDRRTPPPPAAPPTFLDGPLSRHATSTPIPPTCALATPTVPPRCTARGRQQAHHQPRPCAARPLPR